MALASEKLPIVEMFNFQSKLATKKAVLVANLFLILFGSILLAISAQFKVPLGPVPVTLQSMVVMLIATLYGWKLGAATIIAYWSEGILVGGIFSFLPWFANGSGLGYFIGSPTAGFLWGFLPMVLVISFLTHNLGWRTSVIKSVSALLVGQIFLYAVGLAHAYLVVMPFVDWMSTPAEILAIYLYPFIIGDFLKTMIVALTLVCITKNVTKN